MARMSLGEGVDVSLMTLTRGEGGQNEIGTELFDALGVLRSRELEAANRYSGTRQFYSRAFEFGYSFSVEETFEKWGREPLLRDIVAVIREVRPHVLLTMLEDGPGGGQHHQASAQLAAEAFHIAASERWPELGPPHETQRRFVQIWDPNRTAENLVEIPADGYDVELGVSYARLGYASRAQHRCQGMARLHEGVPGHVARWYWAEGIDREPGPASHFFVGLDEAPGIEIVADPWDRDALIRELVAHRAGASADQRAKLDHALALALGLEAEARLDRAWVGEDDGEQTVDLALRHHAAAPVSVRWRIGDGPWTASQTAPPGTRVEQMARFTPRSSTAQRPVPRTPDADLDETDRWWLRTGWRSIEAEVDLILADGARLRRSVPVIHQRVYEALPSLQEVDVQIIPDPTVRLDRDVIVRPVPEGGTAMRIPIRGVVGATRAGRVEVAVEGDGVAASPVSSALAAGESRSLMIEATIANPRPGRIPFGLRAERAGEPASRSGIVEVDYPHIRPGVLERPAQGEIVLVNCAVPEVRVGFVTGSGDRVAEGIEALGLEVTFLDEALLLEGDLDRFDVIMTGARAYKVRPDLIAAQPRLEAWMESGGVLLVQYNKFEFNAGREESPYAPVPGTRVGRGRVTVEESPVVVNDPSHPILTVPNAIGSEDWAGWVQERGLYFLDLPESGYTDLLTLEDPWPFNAGPRGGALVHARVGRGHWVYVGVGLFRQLPSGVPGAYRLLANLLALGET